MNWNESIRQTHRWTAVVFTIGVIVNFAALGRGEPPPWVYALALLPLALLQLTGLYLFVLPYVLKRQRARGAG